MLALLMPGTIKLLGNTEMNINKDKDGGNEMHILISLLQYYDC